TDRPPRRDIGSKPQPDSELAKRHRHLPDAAATALKIWKGKLAARYEAGFFPIDRQKVRLRQYLQNILVCQCLDLGADIQMGIEKQKIGRVAQAEASGPPALSTLSALATLPTLPALSPLIIDTLDASGTEGARCHREWKAVWCAKEVRTEVGGFR